MMSLPKRVDYHRKQTREESKSVCPFPLSVSVFLTVTVCMFLFLSVCLQYFGVLLLLIMGLLEGATLTNFLGGCLILHTAFM